MSARLKRVQTDSKARGWARLCLSVLACLGLGAGGAVISPPRSLAGDPSVPAMDRFGDAEEIGTVTSPLIGGAAGEGSVWVLPNVLSAGFGVPGGAGRFGLGVVRGSAAIQDASFLVKGSDWGGGLSVSSRGSSVLPDGTRSAMAVAAGGGWRPMDWVTLGGALRLVSSAALQGAASPFTQASGLGADAALGIGPPPNGSETVPRWLVSVYGHSLGLSGATGDAWPALGGAAAQARLFERWTVAGGLDRVVDRRDDWTARLGTEAAIGSGWVGRAGTDFHSIGFGGGFSGHGSWGIDLGVRFRRGEAPAFAVSGSLLVSPPGSPRNVGPVGGTRALLLHLAEEAERRQDDLEAYSVYRALAGFDPTDRVAVWRAHTALQRLADRCSVTPDLESAFQEAVNAYADNHPVEAAERFRKLGTRNPAIEELARRAVPSHGRPEATPTPLPAEARSRAERLYQEGLSKYASGRLAEAEKLWKEAAELDPGNADLRHDLERLETKLKTLEGRGVQP